jgi:Zinc dependent phospholipase C
MLAQVRYAAAVVLVLALASPGFSWNNGPSGNANTNLASECASPPYATHDWIADHALAQLPQEERAWLEPFKLVYLLGTEAPDFDGIPAAACQTPHAGYDDRNQGHSVEWASDGSHMVKDRAAQRAQEEYNKAAIAFRQGNRRAAAFYLGAMAHYVGDVSQYGHSIPNEVHHSDYESFVASRTGSFNADHFETFITAKPRARRSAYTAVKRISLVTARGEGQILPASQMDSLWPMKGQAYLDSIGHSLNLGVNELADVLHTFFLNVVTEDS